MARVDIHDIEQWRSLAQLSAYRVGALARELHISLRQLDRYTRQAFQRSPQQWLNEQRLLRAPELLRKQRSVKAVTFQLGFKRVSHFSREFKLHFGLPPRAFLLWGDRRGVPRQHSSTGVWPSPA